MFKSILSKIPFIRGLIVTRGTSAPITIRSLIFQFVFGFNWKAYWPTHPSSRINGVRNIIIGKGCAPGYMPGCYIQGFAKVEIGDYTIIAPNVGIISGNHDLYDYREHISQEVKIGKYCWLGMGSIILPGVTLGDHVVVAANSVVTKSFEEGYVVLAGNPAKPIKTIDKEKVVKYDDCEYIGYFREKDFAKFRKRFLKV